MSHVQPGCLWVVATPIGHRDDLSARAIETLRTVALIAAEDTRHSRPLLLHHGIATPLVADLKEAEPQMKALRKRVLAKRAQAATEGGMAEVRATAPLGDDSEDAAPAVVGPRHQPASRGRGGRGRSSGKRR